MDKKELDYWLSCFIVRRESSEYVRDTLRALFVVVVSLFSHGIYKIYNDLSDLAILFLYHFGKAMQHKRSYKILCEILHDLRNSCKIGKILK